MFVENLEDNICWTLVNHLSFTFSVQKPTSSRISFFLQNLYLLFFKKKKNKKQNELEHFILHEHMNTNVISTRGVFFGAEWRQPVYKADDTC